MASTTNPPAKSFALRFPAQPLMGARYARSTYVTLRLITIPTFTVPV